MGTGNNFTQIKQSFGLVFLPLCRMALSLLEHVDKVWMSNSEDGPCFQNTHGFQLLVR